MGGSKNICLVLCRRESLSFQTNLLGESPLLMNTKEELLTESSLKNRYSKTVAPTGQLDPIFVNS